MVIEHKAVRCQQLLSHLFSGMRSSSTLDYIDQYDRSTLSDTKREGFGDLVPTMSWDGSGNCLM